MTLEEFNKLSDDEKEASLKILGEKYEEVETLEAERDSLSKELESVKEILEDKTKDLKEAKELNFTLARKVNSTPSKGFEETLHEAMGKGVKS